MCGQVVCGISATLATQSDDRCHLVPRMPRKVKVDVTQCHACHAKRMWMSPSGHACHANSRGAPAFHSSPSAPPEPAQCHTCHACHAKVEADVTKYHACHGKRRWMSPSAMPAMPTAAASRRHTKNQARRQGQPQCHKCHACHARVEVDVNKYHACHVKRRWMSPSATHATPTAAASRRHTKNKRAARANPVP